MLELWLQIKDCKFRFNVVTQFKLGKTSSVIQNDLVAVHGMLHLHNGLFRVRFKVIYQEVLPQENGRPISQESRKNTAAVKSLIDETPNLSCAGITTALSK